jgi:hypothetical protein
MDFGHGLLTSRISIRLVGHPACSLRLPFVLVVQQRPWAGTIEPLLRGHTIEKVCVPKSGAESKNCTVVIGIARLAITWQGAISEGGVLGSMKGSSGISVAW